MVAMAPYVNEEDSFRTCLVRRRRRTGGVRFAERTGVVSRADGWWRGLVEFSDTEPNYDTARYAARNPTSNVNG